MNKLLSGWVTVYVFSCIVLTAYLLAPFAESLHTESLRSSVNQTRKACNDRIELIKITCDCPGGVNNGG